MIISASRRTDIPAYYGEWFIDRLKKGEVLVKNPFNRKQITKIPLSPKTVDCIVFWTKNPKPFIQYLDIIDQMGYNYYFQFTITPYNNSIERNIGNKMDILDTFKFLSKRLGSNRIIWRYDPIIFNDIMDIDYHTNEFKHLADNLKTYTKRCVISFVDLYKKILKNTSYLNIEEPNNSQANLLIKNLVDIAKSNSIDIYTCAENINLKNYEIKHGSCIDKNIIEDILGYNIKLTRDKNQRSRCFCIESRDIGSYNTCLTGCTYCYANDNNSELKVIRNKYKKDSAILCYTLVGDEKISDLL